MQKNSVYQDTDLLLHCTVILIKKNLIAVNILRVGNIKEKKSQPLTLAFPPITYSFSFDRLSCANPGRAGN